MSRWERPSQAGKPAEPTVASSPIWSATVVWRDSEDGPDQCRVVTAPDADALREQLAPLRVEHGGKPGYGEQVKGPDGRIAPTGRGSRATNAARMDDLRAALRGDT